MKNKLLTLATTAFMSLASGVSYAQGPYIIRIAGSDTAGNSPDSLKATSSSLRCPSTVAIDKIGNIYIADGGPYGFQNDARIRKINRDSGIITTIVGKVKEADDAINTADSTTNKLAKLAGCASICIDTAGNILIADGVSTIRRVNLKNDSIFTIAGSKNHKGYTGDGGPARNAWLNEPWDITVDAANNIYFADRKNHVVRRINAITGVITTVAGTGVAGFSGDGGLATSARLNQPHGIYRDAIGNLYIADYNNNRVRMVSASGVITTVAGAGPGYNAADNGGPAVNALMTQPVRVTKDAAGNLYIADLGNQRIRRVAAGTGIISNYAGNGNFFSAIDSIGDNGPATAARVVPYGMTFDECGNMIVGGVVGRVRAIVNTIPTVDLLCGLKINSVKNAGEIKASDLTISPNPSNGTFSVLLQAAEAQPMQVAVTDIAGRIVHTTTGRTGTTLTMMLQVAPGMYFVTITTANGKLSQKIAIQ